MLSACFVFLFADTSVFASSEVQIQPGDKVQITVFNHPDLSSEMTVSSAGQIRLPIGGSLDLSGLSEKQASSRVAAALGSYLYHPDVDVRIASQGQFIFFTGSLVGVGTYQPGETLGSAIGAFRQTLGTQAGPGTGTVTSLNNIDLRRVRVLHDRAVSPEYDVEALSRSGFSGPALAPGDSVLLQAKPIRVDVRGSIGNPATVYVYDGDTLAQAVAEVGPIPATTSLTSIALKREGTDSIVSSAGGAFSEPAHDGDIVTLQPAPRVSVLGMVDKSGDQTLQTRPTLLGALYEAGGPNRYADLKHVQLTHNGATTTFDISRLTHGDVSENTAVSDGDVIFVPEGRKIDFTPFTNALGALASLRL
jgi:polysaccharide export outer membrane protein